MSKDLFYKSFFIVQYILKKKINAIILINIYVTGYNFIDKKFTEMVCQTLVKKAQCLTKLKQIQEFDGKIA